MNDKYNNKLCTSNEVISDMSEESIWLCVSS